MPKLGLLARLFSQQQEQYNSSTIRHMFSTGSDISTRRRRKAFLNNVDIRLLLGWLMLHIDRLQLMLLQKTKLIARYSHPPYSAQIYSRHAAPDYLIVYDTNGSKQHYLVRWLFRSNCSSYLWESSLTIMLQSGIILGGLRIYRSADSNKRGAINLPNTLSQSILYPSSSHSRFSVRSQIYAITYICGDNLLIVYYTVGHGLIAINKKKKISRRSFPLPR